MKFSVFPSLLATVGLAVLQVSASPIHIAGFVKDKDGHLTAINGNLPAEVVNLRWGLAAAHAVPEAIAEPHFLSFDELPQEEKQGHAHRHSRGRKLGCRLRMKALALSNWLREKVGLEPIAAHPHHRHGHGRPTPAAPDVNGKILNGSVHILPFRPLMPSNMIAHDGPEATVVDRQWRPRTFNARLHKALMALGPWEGRAVAFVLGCGIGSLLRMIYVLAIITYRSFRSGSDSEAPVEVDILFEEVEDVLPPKYTDEKIAPLEDKVVA